MNLLHSLDLKKAIEAIHVRTTYVRRYVMLLQFAAAKKLFLSNIIYFFNPRTANPVELVFQCLSWLELGS